MALSVQSFTDLLTAGGPIGIKQLFHATGELSGGITLGPTYPNFLKIDAGGAERAITLPAAASNNGLFYVIANWSSGAENLVVNTDLVTINQNDCAILWCDGSAWNVFAVFTIAQS